MIDMYMKIWRSKIINVVHKLWPRPSYKSSNPLIVDHLLDELKLVSLILG